MTATIDLSNFKVSKFYNTDVERDYINAILHAIVDRIAAFEKNSGIADAPSDGNLYGRKNGTWTIVSSSGGGGAGVISLNALSGALSLTSTGGTVTITPSGSTINLETAGGTGGAPYLTGGEAGGLVGVPCNMAFTLNNPGATSRWEIVEGNTALPPGEGFSSTATTASATGTYTTAGTYPYTMAATILTGTGAMATAYSRQKVVISTPTLGPIGTKITSYWDMTEAAGNTRLDKKAALNPAVEIGGTVATNTGPRGGGDLAPVFTGAGTSYLDAGNNASTRVNVASPSTGGSHCMFGWVYWTSGVGTVYSIWDEASSVSLMYAGFASSSGYQGYEGGSTYYATTVTGLTANTWHFFCTWRDAADGKIRSSLDNGAVVVSAAFPSDPNPVNTFDLIFGSDTITGTVLNGRLSRIGWIKGNFLTPTELTAVYNGGPSGSLNWADIVSSGI